MQGALRTALVSTLLACAGCAVAERGFYAPVGRPASSSLVRWRGGVPGQLVFEVACQGSYLDEVGGRPVRTMHMQLDVLRPREGAVTIALDSITVALVFEGVEGDVVSAPAEVYRSDELVQRSLRVPGWSRQAYDLFFDDAEIERPLPELVRLRWTWQAGGDTGWGDCQFRRIPAGGPDGPSLEPLGDLSFGYRDGFYMPIEGNLGPRALQPGIEVREHHVFHDPSGWFVGWF